LRGKGLVSPSPFPFIEKFEGWRNRVATYAVQSILILLTVFTPFAFGSVEVWAISLMELGILSILILSAVQGLSRENSRNAPVNKRDKIIYAILLLFLCLAALQLIPLPRGLLKVVSPRTSTLRSTLSPEVSPLSFPISFVPFSTLFEFFKWFTLSGLFVFLLHWKKLKAGNPFRHKLITLIFVTGVLQSLAGLLEFIIGSGSIIQIAEGPVPFATGTFSNPNYFAGYLLMVLPLGIVLLRTRGLGHEAGDWRHRIASVQGGAILTGFGVIVMALTLILSGSRMGILSLFLSVTAIGLLFADRQISRKVLNIPLVLLLLALLCAIYLGVDAVIERFYTASEGFQSRWTFWKNTVQIIKDFPLLGSGLGTFADVFPLYHTIHIRGFITHAENDFLQLGSEVGTVGAGLLLSLFVFLFVKAVTGIRSMSCKNPDRAVAIGGLTGILALMLHSIVERNIQVPANAFLYTVLWAIVLQSAAAKDQIRGKRNINP
jgi:putative inorganic carbon (HCO3(-)) transporter